MPFEIVRNDITAMRVDAIVNAANESLLGGGGVDGAIHRAAGPALLEECRTLGGCKVGQAKLTKGYRLPCKYIIHTVGPVWQGGNAGEAKQLASCYQNALALACKKGCQSVAFPLISAGAYGYPVEQAIGIASDTIRRFLARHELSVFLVVFGDKAYRLSGQLYDRVRAYIDDAYAAAHGDSLLEQRRRTAVYCAQVAPVCPAPCAAPKALSLEEELRDRDESFSQAVLRLIAKQGMKNSDCYKKANLDKKLFSKLVNDPHYKPKKTTAVALAIALGLSFAETQELLMKAGFALSKSDTFDIIITFCIRHNCYDVFEINNLLFDYDQPLLGSVIY